MTSFEKENLLVSVGQKIRRTRLQQDKTTKQVAAHLKITTQSYGCIERGSREMGFTRLIQIATYFQVSVQELLEVQ